MVFSQFFAIILVVFLQPVFSVSPVSEQGLPWDAVDATDLCYQNRLLRDVKDLLADSTNCHSYIHCFYLNETFAVGIRRQCPAGTFWRQAVSQCMPEGSIPCEDACLDETTHAKGCYAGTGCRQYFVCAHTTSYGMCCPHGTAFIAATCSCETSETCEDRCQQQGAPSPTTVLPPLKISETTCQDSWGSFISFVPGEVNAYQPMDAAGTLLPKMYCPEETGFDLATCTCSTYLSDIEINALSRAAERPVKRRALLWLPFDDDGKDRSVQKFATFLYDGAERDVTISARGGGSLKVNGGFVSIPGLKAIDTGDKGSWCAFFRCETGLCSTQGAILSNNKDALKKEYTVTLAVQPQNSLTARLHLWYPVNEDKITDSEITGTQSNGWNHVCLTYDGTTMRTYLNGDVITKTDGGGYLWVAQSPFILGFDPSFGSFKGHIDDVLVTAFTMTKEEVEAHRNGDRDYLTKQGFWPY